MERVRIVDLCFMHEELRKIQKPSARVVDCLAKLESMMCNSVEGMAPTADFVEALKEFKSAEKAQ